MIPSFMFLLLLLLLVSNACAAAAYASLLKNNETENKRTSDLRAARGKVGVRIVGGDDAAKGRYSYYVSLVDGGMFHRCGGSLIFL
jgi:secreted trypsin-like serine protease